MLSTLLGAKFGAAVAGVAVALGGTAVVVYTSSVNTAAQNAADTTIGAPAAQPTDTPPPHPTGSPTSHPTATPVGPDATGPAAFGLCTAWSHHQTNGARTHGKSQDSVAFKNLATAAGGVDKITAYCATIPSPANTSHPTGKPSTLPTPLSTGHPTGKPSTLPTPSSTSHPTGKPSTLPTPGSTHRG